MPLFGNPRLLPLSLILFFSSYSQAITTPHLPPPNKEKDNTHTHTHYTSAQKIRVSSLYEGVINICFLLLTLN